jgi:uncharacterized protein (TIGR00290 family)
MLAAVMTKVLLAWSSGKDSAWALQLLREHGPGEVVGLMTTVNQTNDRVSMHAVRKQLLEAQARATGLPLLEVPLPEPCSNADYEAAMREALAQARRKGVTAVAFGDLFLQDVRSYREERLRPTGLEALFPLWQSPTGELARAMLAAGLKARITCVDPKQLDPAFVGRELDAQLLDELPASVDPCGERGEFHTFCYDGPMFREPIPVAVGPVVERGGFVYADLTSPPA